MTVATVGTQQRTNTAAPILSLLEVIGPLKELIEIMWWTDAVPRSYKWSRREGDYPPDKTKALMLASALLGNSMGVDPFRSWANIHPTGQGRFAIASDFKVGLATAAGHQIETIKRDPNECVIRCRRRNSETWTELRLTMDDARQAGWTSNPLYDKVPGDMLYHRTSGRAADMVGSDVTLGIVTYEDYAELPAERSGQDLAGLVHRTLAQRAGKVAELSGSPEPGDALRGSLVARLVEEAENAPAPPVTPTERTRGLDWDDIAEGFEVKSEPQVEVETSEEKHRDDPDPQDPATWGIKEQISNSTWEAINARFNTAHAINGDGKIAARRRVIIHVIGRTVENKSELTEQEGRLVLDYLTSRDASTVRQVAYGWDDDDDETDELGVVD